MWHLQAARAVNPLRVPLAACCQCRLGEAKARAGKPHVAPDEGHALTAMTSDTGQPHPSDPPAGRGPPPLPPPGVLGYAGALAPEQPPFGIEYATPGRTTQRWPADEPAGWTWILLIFGWFVGGAGAVALLAVLIGFAFGFPLLVAVPMALLALVSVALVLQSRRRAHAMAVLGYLEQAVRLNLPLPDLLAAAA